MYFLFGLFSYPYDLLQDLFWVLKKTSRCDSSFEYPRHMFWLRDLNHALLSSKSLVDGLLQENLILCLQMSNQKGQARYAHLHSLSMALLSTPGLQIRVCIGKLFSLFLIQNICCGYSKEPSHIMYQMLVNA